jgi:hypothetical protein
MSSLLFKKVVCGNKYTFFFFRSYADDEEWAGLAEQLPPALPRQVLQYNEMKPLSIYNEQGFPISLRERFKYEALLR